MCVCVVCCVCVRVCVCVLCVVCVCVQELGLRRIAEAVEVCLGERGVFHTQASRLG